MYYYMLLSREFELRAVALYKQGRLVGPLYTGIGHEAIAVGSAWALAADDVIAPMHRDMAARFVRGMTPSEVYAQYMGRATGPSRGKDGNHHLGNIKNRMIGFVSHLGALIPVAAGVALASRITGANYVALTYIGDGSTSIGDFHEGLNFAAVRNLPLILVIENNQFAYTTPVSHQYACKRLVDRALGYGIRGVEVDGNDVLAMHAATSEAVDFARTGGGPSLIEAVTMRVRGHSENDDASYVPPDLPEAWRQKDPIAAFRRRLAECDILTDEIEKGINQRIEQEISRAVTFAESSPWPLSQDTCTDVYSN